jgi:hypothetical protein
MKHLLALALAFAISGCGSDDAGLDAKVQTICERPVLLAPKKPYRIEPGDELLVCYGVDAKPGQKRHIVEFHPRIDREAVLHHMSLLQAPSSVSPIPEACDSEAMTSWRSLYGWSPGSSSFALPPEAGFAEDPETHYVVQLHYLNTGTTPIEDESGFELCESETLRDNDADIMAFGGHEFTIPAASKLGVTCSIDVPSYGATTHLFAAFPHMHRLGASISTSVQPQGTGAPVDIGSVGDWSFDEQRWLPIDYVLKPGDRVSTTCNWDNPQSHGVGFGPGIDDEMCYSFTMYYPRIENPDWHWALPALYSTCAP